MYIRHYLYSGLSQQFYRSNNRLKPTHFTFSPFWNSHVWYVSL